MPNGAYMDPTSASVRYRRITADSSIFSPTCEITTVPEIAVAWRITARERRAVVGIRVNGAQGLPVGIKASTWSTSAGHPIPHISAANPGVSPHRPCRMLHTAAGIKSCGID